jgi:hypothetical protein
MARGDQLGRLGVPAGGTARRLAGLAGAAGTRRTGHARIDHQVMLFTSRS